MYGTGEYEGAFAFVFASYARSRKPDDLDEAMLL